MVGLVADLQGSVHQDHQKRWGRAAAGEKEG